MIAADHQEPYDPACPCGTCSGYMEMLEREHYQEALAQAQAEQEQYEEMMREDQS